MNRAGDPKNPLHGLQPGGSLRWNQNSSGVSGISEEADHFGSALAPGISTVTGNQLAIGVANSGSIYVFLGSAAGLANFRQVWHQNRYRIEARLLFAGRMVKTVDPSGSTAISP